MTTETTNEVEFSDSWTVPPRWATPRTPERPTYGGAVAAASAAMGRPFMPHQRQIVDVFLEVQSEEAGDPEPGEWAYDDGTALLERRAGKTSLCAPVVTHRQRLVERAQMFMTAQTRDKARRRWIDITDDLIGSVLRQDVRRKLSIGHEELRWPATSGILVPFAPNEDGLHSETPDFVLVDELWAFDQEQARGIKAGYVPAFATSSGQALKMSTAGTERSAWLNEDRRAGRAAVESGVRLGRFYYEHSLPDRVDGVRVKDLDDEALIAACVANHPAVCHFPGCVGPRRKAPCPHGFTVRPAAIRSAWDALNDRAEFIRAYGNRSHDDLSALWTALAEGTWGDQTDPGGIPVEARSVFGVWVDKEGLDAAVSSGWRDELGRMHVESVDRRDGIEWVRPWLAEKPSRKATPVCVANVGAARNVADQLEAAGFTVVRVSQADLAAAVSRHREQLAAGLWWHRVSTEATASAAAVGLRKAGGGRVWERIGDSIALVGSQTLAGWGFDHAPVLAPTKFWMG
jgi:hypothetical protein